jgi:hypothetical protein
MSIGSTDGTSDGTPLGAELGTSEGFLLLIVGAERLSLGSSLGV